MHTKYTCCIRILLSPSKVDCTSYSPFKWPTRFSVLRPCPPQASRHSWYICWLNFGEFNFHRYINPRYSCSSDLKSSHIVPCESSLECTWKDMDHFVWLGGSLDIYLFQVISSKTHSVSGAHGKRREWFRTVSMITVQGPLTRFTKQ